MGRPPVDAHAITLRLHRTMIQAIDDRRSEEPDVPTRTEMIRRALEEWLKLTYKSDG